MFKNVIIFGKNNGTEGLIGDTEGVPQALSVDENGLLRVNTIVGGGVDNFDIITLPENEYSITTTSSDKINKSHKGGIFLFSILEIIDGTFSITIQGKDSISGQYYDILESAAYDNTFSGLVAMKIYPGVTETPNISASDLLPYTYRVRLNAVGNTAPAFLSVGANLIV